MRSSRALLLVGLSLVGSPTFAAPATIPPILSGIPTRAQINQRCNMWVARSTALRTALEQSKGPATVATLTAYDRLSEIIFDGALESSLYREVGMTPAARSSGEKCEVRMLSQQTKLSLSRPI